MEPKLIGMCVVRGKNEGTDVEVIARAQGWIACLSARAQCKLLGEMVLLPQGLNGTLVRAVETKLVPRRCHSRLDFSEAVDAQGSVPPSDQPFLGSVCMP